MGIWCCGVRETERLVPCFCLKPNKFSIGFFVANASACSVRDLGAGHLLPAILLKGNGPMSVNCNLIIDSCCDLPLEMVQVEGVDLLNYNYILDRVTYPDDFFQSTTPHEFYQNMREGASPSTSQITMADLTDAFTRACESGVPTVYLSMSSGISNNYNTACMIADQVKAGYPDAELYVVDTLLGCTPEGILVLEAIRQRSLGLTAQEMVRWAEEARYYVNTLFMVDDLDALHRGGRLPKSVAVAGNALNVKPLLNFDVNGELGMSGVARGRKKGLKAIAAFFADNRDQKSAGVVLVGHADCPKDAEKLADEISKAAPTTNVVVHNIGMTIGSHVGADMVSCSFWGVDRRENLSLADRIARKVKGE